MPEQTASSQAKLHLSVIIPTCNRAAIIEANLRHLSKQVLPSEQYEVLVGDDASEDDTFARLQAMHTPYSLRLFRMSERSGPGKVKNLLIREARAEKLVILNDDALLSPGGLAMHDAVLDMTKGRNIAVLGKFSFPLDFQQTLMGCLLEQTNLSFRYPLMESHGLYGAMGSYSCNLGVYKSAVVEAGLFDEGMAGTGAEDIELGDRLAGRGHLVLYLDECVATHEHRMTIHDFCRAQIGRGAGGGRTFRHPELVFHYDDSDMSALEQLRRGFPKHSRKWTGWWMPCTKRPGSIPPLRMVRPFPGGTRPCATVPMPCGGWTRKRLSSKCRRLCAKSWGFFPLPSCPRRPWAPRFRCVPCSSGT